jgi:hypothetical protein
MVMWGNDRKWISNKEAHLKHFIICAVSVLGTHDTMYKSSYGKNGTLLFSIHEIASFGDLRSEGVMQCNRWQRI